MWNAFLRLIAACDQSYHLRLIAEISLWNTAQVIKPIWDKIVIVINQKSNKVIHPSLFDKIFGYEQDIFLTYLFLLFKYYIYLCKFQDKSPNFEAFKAYVASSKDVEYRIAKKKHKLVTHFRKWRFELWFFFSTCNYIDIVLH